MIHNTVHTLHEIFIVFCIVIVLYILHVLYVCDLFQILLSLEKFYMCVFVHARAYVCACARAGNKLI